MTKTLAPIDYCRAENVIKRLNADAKLEEFCSHSSDTVGAWPWGPGGSAVMYELVTCVPSPLIIITNTTCQTSDLQRHNLGLRDCSEPLPGIPVRLVLRSPRVSHTLWSRAQWTLGDDIEDCIESRAECLTLEIGTAGQLEVVGGPGNRQ